MIYERKLNVVSKVFYDAFKMAEVTWTEHHLIQWAEQQLLGDGGVGGLDRDDFQLEVHSVSLLNLHGPVQVQAAAAHTSPGAAAWTSGERWACRRAPRGSWGCSSADAARPGCPESPGPGSGAAGSSLGPDLPPPGGPDRTEQAEYFLNCTSVLCWMSLSIFITVPWWDQQQEVLRSLKLKC